MRYDFSCPRCGIVEEIFRSVVNRDELAKCSCGTMMKRVLFVGIRTGKGSKQYGRQIVSDSLAMNPNQIAEHRRMFPNVQVTKEGQPVFDNFTEHEAYLKKCNIVKKPKSKKKKGKRIA